MRRGKMVLFHYFSCTIIFMIFMSSFDPFSEVRDREIFSSLDAFREMAMAARQ